MFALKSDQPVLLNPGPVVLTKRVRESLSLPDLCHREPEFAEIQQRVRRKLLEVYEATNSNYEVALLTGSGTSAVECMVGSLVSDDAYTLVVANGVYGERMSEILTVQKKKFQQVRGAWLNPIDLKQVRAELEGARTRGNPIQFIATVHHETTTGRLNDLEGLGRLAREFNAKLLLDSVSSFGGEWIDFKGWNVAAAAACANKCLHGVPGVAFVLVHKECLARRKSAATSLYLDLFKQVAGSERGYSPFTHSVHVMRALEVALDEMRDQGGWRARHELYRSRMTRICTVFQRLGVRSLLDDPENISSILASFKMPSEKAYQGYHDFLKQNGYVIYAGQGNLSGEIFRVAVMGEIDASLDRFLELSEEYLRA